MTPQVSFIAGASGITVLMGGREYVVGRDHPNYARIKDALVAQQFDGLMDLMDTRSAVRKFIAAAGMVLKDDQVTLAGHQFSRAVTSKVLAMIEQGNPATALAAFLTKVLLNPSKTAREELLLFCVANGFMIHEDGDILAYKSVRDDYTDIHSGKFKNTVGSVLEMPRADVDDNREVTCSTGFHFAAHNYASTWHGHGDARMLIVKVNPADVVSIPSDYGNQKARTCKYVVLAEIEHGRRLVDRGVFEATDFDPNARKRDRLTEQLKSAAEALAKLVESRKTLDAEIAAVKTAGGAAAPTQLDELARSVRSIMAAEKRVSEIETELKALPAPVAPVVP